MSFTAGQKSNLGVGLGMSHVQGAFSELEPRLKALVQCLFSRRMTCIGGLLALATARTNCRNEDDLDLDQPRLNVSFRKHSD